jgi:hypothetical protein
MICRKCGAPQGLRRESRNGFFQRTIFPLFGLFPWECVFCRKTRLYYQKYEEPEIRNPRQSSPSATVPARPAPRPVRS